MEFGSAAAGKPIFGSDLSGEMTFCAIGILVCVYNYFYLSARMREEMSRSKEERDIG